MSVVLANSDLIDKVGFVVVPSILAGERIVSRLPVLLWSFRSRAALQLEIVALRHQINVLRRSAKRPKLTDADRVFWAWLSEVWSDWRTALVIVRPETVIAWHRRGFRRFWTWKVHHGKCGRPGLPEEIRELIRRMSCENPLWGASRIHGELLKLGIDVGETSVGKNHMRSRVSIDFFAAPTLRFEILYVSLALAHDRRRIVHFGVKAHSTAEWTAQQLREAFPWDSASKYLLRDRDRIFGAEFTKQVENLGIEEMLSAPRSPWQRAYIERVIGSIRRECLDNMIVYNEASLYRQMKSFVDYYHETRTHLSLQNDAPMSRPAQPPGYGRVIALPQVGGLHHRYERRTIRKK